MNTDITAVLMAVQSAGELVAPAAGLVVPSACCHGRLTAWNFDSLCFAHRPLCLHFPTPNADLRPSCAHTG